MSLGALANLNLGNRIRTLQIGQDFHEKLKPYHLISAGRTDYSIMPANKVSQFDSSLWKTVYVYEVAIQVN